jgi:hypothetical protein
LRDKASTAYASTPPAADPASLLASPPMNGALT